MAYPQFGVVNPQYKTLTPNGRPSAAQDPFQAALLSQQRLSEATRRPAAQQTATMDQIRAAGSPVSLVPPPALAPPPPVAPSPPQGSATQAPTFIAPPLGAQTATTAGGRGRGDMGVQPGDPNRTQYYAAKANEYNNASSRWHGTITENDVRAFDQYATKYRAATGKDATIWDWLAGGRPTTTGDYYFDKAVEYNSYDTPWKGTIGRADVLSFQKYVQELKAMGQNGPHITEWLNAGRPEHPRGANDPYAGWTNGSTRGIGTNAQAAPNGWITLPSGAKLPAPAASAPAPAAVTPTTTTGPTATASDDPPLVAGPGVAATPPADPAAPQLDSFEDTLRKTIAEVESRFRPGFDRANDDLQKRLMQSGAVSGALNAGGFNEVVGDALVDQGAEQSAVLGKEISAQTINATQLAMQKYVAELDDSFKHLQLKTNADLEAKAQELQKYGIDKGDLLERYKAELGYKGQVYSADREVDAAALHAAASSAAAQASADAAKYNADRDYQLGLVNADVNREGNIFAGLISLASQNSDWMKWFLASDPFGIFNGNQVPGDVVVTP